MYYLTSFNPILGAALMVAVMLIVLIALELYNGRRMQKLAYPAYEYALKRAEQEAGRIVEEARAQARVLLEKAEAQSLELSGAHKSEDEAAERSYQETLKTMLGDFEKKLQESARATHDASERITAALSLQLEAQSKEVQTRLAAAYESIQNETARRVDEQVTRAFATAKLETEKYEQARKMAIDSRALALVGETVKIALQRTLPKDMHAELVRAALEEAKKNNVF